MTESATLQVNVVEKGAKQVSVNLDAVSRAAANAEKSTDKFSKELSKTEIEAKKTGSALDALKNIAASYITIKTLQGAIKMADTMTVLRSQVNQVTKSQEESIAVQEQLFDISNRTYASLEATTTLYTRTARALQHLNKSSAETLKFTEAINNAMRLGGVSAGEQASALLQLSQAMGSGVLQGDEFRSLAENAPILLDILSKHMGVMRGELKQMGSEGKITSEIIFEAMTKAGDGLAKKAADMPVTFGQAMQVMNTHVMSFVDSMMNGSGIMTAVAAMVITLAENIEYILVPAMAVSGVFAVKALTTAFMMLGGPMGIIAVVVGALGLLAVAFGNSSKEAEKLAGKVDNAYSEIETMTKAKLNEFKLDLRVVIENDAKSYEEARNELAKMEKALQIRGERLKKYVIGSNQYNEEIEGIKALNQKIIRQSALVEDLNNAYSKRLDMHKKATVLQNQGGAVDLVGPLPYKESKAFVKSMNEYKKIQALIGKEGEVLKHEMKLQNGELKGLIGNEEERLKKMAEITDEMRKQQGLLSGMQSTVDRIMDNYVLSTLNDRDGLVYSLTREGFSEEDAQIYADIQAAADKNNEAKAALAKSLSGGSNPFTDRLKALSEEAAKLQAVNAEIKKYGEVGRYTALQEITFELNNQNGVLSNISATQKQMLLDQAVMLDNQRQANEILTLGSDYTQRLSDMSFELELIGKTADEIKDLRFIRELEIRTRAIANGASQETIDLLEKEIAKIKELKDAYDGKRDTTNNSPLGGISDGFDKYVNSMGDVRGQFATATESMFGGLTDAVANFASGANKDFADMTRSVLQNISKMLIQMAILNAMKMAFGGFFGGLGMANGGAAYANGGMVGFADGGFTGFGSKYEPAGIVHKGEVVWSQADVARHGGLEQVERMRKGYSLGGAAGFGNTLPQIANDQKNNRNDGITINITQYEDGSQEVDVTKDGRALENLVKVNVKKEIANQLRSGGQLAG